MFVVVRILLVTDTGAWQAQWLCVWTCLLNETQWLCNRWTGCPLHLLPLWFSQLIRNQWWLCELRICPVGSVCCGSTPQELLMPMNNRHGTLQEHVCWWFVMFVWWGGGSLDGWQCLCGGWVCCLVRSVIWITIIINTSVHQAQYCGVRTGLLHALYCLCNSTCYGRIVAGRSASQATIWTRVV